MQRDGAGAEQKREGGPKEDGGGRRSHGLMRVMASSHAGTKWFLPLRLADYCQHTPPQNMKAGKIPTRYVGGGEGSSAAAAQGADK